MLLHGTYNYQLYELESVTHLIKVDVKNVVDKLYDIFRSDMTAMIVDN